MNARRHLAFALFGASLLAAGCGEAAKPTAAEASQDSTVAATATLPKDGHARITDPAGRVRLAGDMKNGQREGVWTSYDAQGRVKSRNEYRQGRLNGITTVYRPNGALYYTGQYRQDKETGTWKFYDDAGNLYRTVGYDSSGAVINDPGPPAP
jgi:hypothetical protein